MLIAFPKKIIPLLLVLVVSACADTPIQNPSLISPDSSSQYPTPSSPQQADGTLMNVEWIMAASDSPSFTPSVTMRLSPNKYYVGICNSFNGASWLDGDRLSFRLGISTKKACPTNIQSWSDAFFAAMEKGVRFEHKQKTLTFFDASNNAVLYQFQARFMPAPNAEKKFIEIDKSLIPCENNPQKQCFKIRFLDLNTQFVEVGQASWQTQEKIFGYDQSEHTANVKMRILIDRQSTPPAGLSSPVWYNDMIYQWGN